jgi:hypothetical protein
VQSSTVNKQSLVRQAQASNARWQHLDAVFEELPSRPSYVRSHLPQPHTGPRFFNL